MIVLFLLSLFSFQLPNDIENYMEYYLMGSIAQVRINLRSLVKSRITNKIHTRQTEIHEYLILLSSDPTGTRKTRN